MRNRMSVKDVSKLLNLSESVIYTLLKNRQIYATKVKGRWVFERDLVVAWLEQRRIVAPEPPPPKYQDS